MRPICMGTEFDCKAYIPGYFDMADSSVNSNGNMSPYYDEKKPTGHLNHKFTILSANGSIHYDKEMLKRTMLVHDATFRKQVYELHRLYKIQKDLMAQFHGEEFSVHTRYADILKSRTYASQAPPGDVKGVWKTGTPICGHDLKQSSIDFINETSSQYSVNGASRRCNNTRSIEKMLDLQLPADVYADDKYVKILDDDPLKCLPWTNGSLHDGNDRIKLGNSESKHLKSRTTDGQPRHNSAKPTVGPFNMKITDSISVGTSTQKQHNLSRRVNLDLLDLQGSSRAQCARETSGSSFFDANAKMRHTNSFVQKKDDPSTSIAWLQHKQNGAISSFGQDLSSNSSFNHLIPAPALFNDGAPNSPWQSNNMIHYGISMDITNTPCHQRLRIHGKLQDWEPPTHQNIMKDLDLNDVPPDTSAFSEKGIINLTESQVPASCANGLPQTFISSTPHSNNETPTRTRSFPISTAAEKDSQCSPHPERDINIAAPIKCEAGNEMQSQSKSGGNSSIRNLFDLNEALPITDDVEVDPCEPEGGIVAPQEPNDRDSLAITAAENLVAMVNDNNTQPGSPQLGTLHWFADLATSKQDNEDSDDDFEALTLKLEETKSYDELVSSPPGTLVEGYSNDGHCSAAASLLLARPRRRGRARGRRSQRKKDFQRDILPTLASLPAQQVSEDLRLLGRPKPAAPAKRGGGGGRNNGQKQQQQPRGRRPARSGAAAVVVVAEEEAEVGLPPATLPPPPLAPAEPLVVTRWGRTTRRCRRPRCPPANNASLHVA